MPHHTCNASQRAEQLPAASHTATQESGQHVMAHATSPSSPQSPRPGRRTWSLSWNSGPRGLHDELHVICHRKPALSAATVSQPRTNDSGLYMWITRSTPLLQLRVTCHHTRDVSQRMHAPASQSRGACVSHIMTSIPCAHLRHGWVVAAPQRAAAQGDNAGPSRSSSPSPSPSFAFLPPFPSRPTPLLQPSHVSNALAQGFPLHSNSSDLDGERTPVIPSAKAMGKRRMAEGDADGDGKRDTPFQVSSS